MCKMLVGKAPNQRAAIIQLINKAGSSFLLNFIKLINEKELVSAWCLALGQSSQLGMVLSCKRISHY